MAAETSAGVNAKANASIWVGSIVLGDVLPCTGELKGSWGLNGP